jgi:hypothetical protein
MTQAPAGRRRQAWQDNRPTRQALRGVRGASNPRRNAAGGKPARPGTRARPFPAYQITEVANNLKGVIPQSPTLSINPENWYFVK